MDSCLFNCKSENFDCQKNCNGDTDCARECNRNLADCDNGNITCSTSCYHNTSGCPCMDYCYDGCYNSNNEICDNDICYCQDFDPEEDLDYQACSLEVSNQFFICTIGCNGSAGCEEACSASMKEEYSKCPCQVPYNRYMIHI